MNLKLIKLAGFKSFVDLTMIPLPGQVSGIIGPNGCGKSNIVDAIRWVIGESSAKQLRGQLMADVIFNGSHTRKPVGKAIVELVFDNTQAKIAGDLNRFSEISIRREVSQEGHSQYYLNGTSCRRRDIIDIFLGTGLGPRSYAIIEQGMISQLIEAKPEEFRILLEEAAGISKYKERRRETETRINHTQENLDRLNDLIEELSKQLRHLKRQANAAEQYKNFKQQERLLQGQVKALQFRQLTELCEEQDSKIMERQSTLNECLQKVHEIEDQQTRLRDQQLVHQQEREQIQERYYELNTDINRIEQQIKHWQQQIDQWQDELLENTRIHQELQDNMQEYTQQQQAFSDEIAQLRPKLLLAEQQQKQEEENLKSAENNRQQQQQEWEQLQSKISELSKKYEVEKTKCEHRDQQCQQLEIRQQELRQRQSDIHLESIQDEMVALETEMMTFDHQLTELQQQLQKSHAAIQQQRTDHQQHKQDLNVSQTIVQKLQQQLASLEGIQQAALGQQDTNASQWLKEHGLQNHPRLGQTMQVVAGWEVAVETVLTGYFDAICLEVNLTDLYPEMMRLEKGRLTLISNYSVMSSSLNQQVIDTINPQLIAQHKIPLSSLVKADYPLHPWLKSIYIADSLEQAQENLSQLERDESFITREGVWLSHHWIRISKSKDQQTGVLIREHELRQLRQEMVEQKKKYEHQVQLIQQSEEQLQSLENQRDSLHRQNQQLGREAAEVKSALNATKIRLTTLQQQHQQISLEIQKNDQQLLELQEQRVVIEQQLLEYEALKTQFILQQQQQLKGKEEAQQGLLQIRTLAQETRRIVNELRISLTTAEKQLSMINQRLQRDQQQFHKIDERHQLLKQNLSSNAEPIEEAEDELPILMAERTQIETELKRIENNLNVNQQELSQCTQIWQQLNQKISTLQQQLQHLQIQHQETIVRQSTIQEYLEDAKMVLDNLLKILPEHVSIQEVEQQVVQMTAKITRLGAINLAAIDEYEAVSERKTYLDKQQLDLLEALEILRQAIHKIDRETRHKFRDTYDRVNKSFQEIFPRIFGGGHAELLLTSEEILQAGVMVKAHPPGKKNASVHSLSGGEKALTAISLVFALFQLNPAPFCILDEVDAPLDDVNVTRFCQLVKEMSEKTQFIVISHNKVTMSFADHLMGVTMQEAGVSRIVSVDMQQAVALVDS